MSRLYSQAAAVLGPSLTDQRKRSKFEQSLKTRTYDDSVSNKRLTHLLVSETLKHKRLIDCVLKLAQLKLKDISDNEALVYILIFELLFGKRQKIQGGGGLKRILLENETRLRNALSIAEKKYPDLVPAKEEDVSIPRFCRVNTLKTTVDKVLKELGEQAELDEHVPNLIKLPPGTDLHDHAMVSSGEIILQDKSSCFPVAALVLEMKRKNLTRCDAIDCCAAPGNKTTQLAAELTQGKSRLIAFDKSTTRYELLKKRVDQAGASGIVKVKNGDFLQTDPEDKEFKDVRTILLDPSCSGSGSFSLERLNEKRMTETDERVLRLADFQLQALKHALSYPQAQLVSYSTCSILYPENELVVKKALEEYSGQWQLVPALPKWERRGVHRPDGLSEEECKLVARADFTLGDKTGGFFVALFERIPENIMKDDEPLAFNDPSSESNQPKTTVTRKKSRRSFTPDEAVHRHKRILTENRNRDMN